MTARGRVPRILLFLIVLVPLGYLLVQVGSYLWASSHFHSAQRAANARDFPAARRHLAQCSRVWSSDAETLLMASQAARRDGDIGEARRLLEATRAANAVPEAVDVEWRLLRVQTGDLTDAARYASFCEAKPDDPLTHLLLEALVVGSLRSMDLPLARRCLKLWQEQQTTTPGRIQGLVWQGDIQIRTGDFERALTSYRHALALDPENQGARQRLGELLTRYSPEEAVTHLDWLLARKPGDRSLRLHLARCKRALGEPEEARALIDRLLAEDASDVPALIDRGQVEMDLGHAEGAERWLRRAEQLAPDKRDLNLALARCMLLAGKDAEAGRYQARVTRIDASLNRRFGPTGKAPAHAPP